MPTKRFLLLQARAEQNATDSEYEAVRRFTGLGQEQLIRVNLVKEPMPDVDAMDLAGIIIGGSPFNVSDEVTKKSELQLKVEAELFDLISNLITQDFPLLGLCYGLGLISELLGGRVDTQFGEGASAANIELTDAGRIDPLLAGLPNQFAALTGHNEAISKLPKPAVLLATSGTAPVQMIRIGNNVYATQFHPELDKAGLKERLTIYLDKGYCQPDEYDAVIESIAYAHLEHSHKILKNFVQLYSADPPF